MDAQLRLLATTDAEVGPDDQASNVGTRSWRLSSRTREVGRQGVAQAREALQAARRPTVRGEREHGREAA
jgi:hypothetical protein